MISSPFLHHRWIVKQWWYVLGDFIHRHLKKNYSLIANDKDANILIQNRRRKKIWIIIFSTLCCIRDRGRNMNDFRLHLGHSHWIHIGFLYSKHRISKRSLSNEDILRLDVLHRFRLAIFSNRMTYRLSSKFNFFFFFFC